MPPDVTAFRRVRDQLVTTPMRGGRWPRHRAGDAARLDLYGDLVAIPADDRCAQRHLVVLSDPDVVARQRIEGRVVLSWAVRGPAQDDNVGANRGGVMPKVLYEAVAMLNVVRLTIFAVALLASPRRPGPLATSAL